jgi:hypothetical protein
MAVDYKLNGYDPKLPGGFREKVRKSQWRMHSEIRKPANPRSQLQLGRKRRLLAMRMWSIRQSWPPSTLQAI